MAGKKNKDLSKKSKELKKEKKLSSANSSNESLVSSQKKLKLSLPNSHFKDHAVLYNGGIYPSSNIAYPKSWKKVKGKIENEDKKREEYKEAGLIPFYNTIKAGKNSSRVGNQLFELDKLREKMPTVEYAVEKPSLLTAEEKKKSVGSFEGQNIQAKTDKQVFSGLYFQDALPDQVTHFFKAKIVKVDADDTGHYSAYMNTLYSGVEPKKVFFGDKEGKIDKVRANRFLAEQIVSSLSYQRNKGFTDAMNDILKQGEFKEGYEENNVSPLLYRDSSGNPTDLTVTEEKLAIADKIYEAPTVIDVDTVDNQQFHFNYDFEDIPNNAEPKLIFEMNDNDKRNKEVRNLDSDTLLFIAVQRLQLEPDSVQHLLEGLYYQGWISYPRADQLKATDQPITLIKKDYKNNFKGTDNEKELLRIIDESEKSVAKNEPYIQYGSWILKIGTKEYATSGRIIADQKTEYDKNEIDINIENGVSPEEITEFLNENEIGTPATRTTYFSSLKEAGIISLDKQRKYQLDRRGLIFASAYKGLVDSGQSSIVLRNQLKNINVITPAQAKELSKETGIKVKPVNEEQAIKQMLDLVNSFKVIDRQELKQFTLEESKIVLDRSNDLAKLEQETED